MVRYSDTKACWHSCMAVVMEYHRPYEPYECIIGGLFGLIMDSEIPL